jgi:hypothetical protein
LTHSAATSIVRFNLWEDSTDLGPLIRWEGAKASTAENFLGYGRLQRTPSAGAKVYTIRGWGSTGTSTMYLGNGTTIPPAIFTITRV